METLNKFPFKSMLPIIDTITDYEDSINVFQIQKAARACVPDTHEVTSFISLLTHFGKIKRINEGWIRVYPQTFDGRNPHRMFYLKKILKVIKVLSSTPLTIEEISQKTQLDIPVVTEFLEFLNKLTRKGYITKTKSKFNVSWTLVKFPEPTELINTI
ncbi:MAG: hypothetical protein ACXAC7_13555 [Candidatus Hodarchaeales archaeon]|jgi:hypothetical protein